jgi:hypothetical protein
VVELDPDKLVRRRPGGPFPHLDVNASSADRDRETAWADLCRQRGWVCEICGAVPELGKKFEDDICDECRLRLKIE